jgi:predicted metal-dependent hydrolase
LDRFGKKSKIIFGEKIPFYIKKMGENNEFKVNSWNVRLMKTRWGSCNIRIINYVLI